MGIKFEQIKLFTIAISSDFLIYFCRRPKAFNCIAALKHKFEIYWSSFRRSSIVTDSFTDMVNLISLLSIVSLHVASLSSLFKIIAWNLSALRINSFCLNQADSGFCPKVSKGSVKVSHVAVIALSSTKLWKSDFLMHKNKSLRNILTRIIPDLELCGIPDKMFGMYYRCFWF